MYTVVYGSSDKPEPTTTPQTGFVMVGAEMCQYYSVETIWQTQILTQTEDNELCSAPSPYT